MNEKINEWDSISQFSCFVDEDPKKVQCKCGKIISLDRSYKTRNFLRHIQSSSCLLGKNKQVSLKHFIKKVDNNNIIGII
jgi:hypothetical protein